GLRTRHTPSLSKTAKPPVYARLDSQVHAQNLPWPTFMADSHDEGGLKRAPCSTQSGSPCAGASSPIASRLPLPARSTSGTSVVRLITVVNSTPVAPPSRIKSIREP